MGMKKFINFIKKPKNLYMSIAVMLIVIVGLTSVSFSYYIEDTSNGSQIMKLNKINTFIQSDDLKSDEITLTAYGEKTITINVISNNPYNNDFIIFHTNENVKVTANKKIMKNIESMSVQTYDLTFTNTSEEIQVDKLGIKNGYTGSDIEIDGIQIK